MPINLDLTNILRNKLTCQNKDKNALPSQSLSGYSFIPFLSKKQKMASDVFETSMLHKSNKKVSFLGKLSKVKKDKISEEKAQQFFEIFPARNRDIEDVKKIFEENPKIQDSDFEELKSNFDKVIETFKESGRLSNWAYTKACYKEPSLFTTKSDTIVSNVNGVYEKFKGFGLKLDKYLDACTYFPVLYKTEPDKIIGNIEKVYDAFKKEISMKDYINLCMAQPRLLLRNPDETINRINANKFVSKVKNKHFNFQNCDYNNSMESTYLQLAFPLEFKSNNDYKTVTEKIISYYKNHPASWCELKLPSETGAQEYKKVLTEFSVKNIGRNIFEKPAVKENKDTKTIQRTSLSDEDLDSGLKKIDEYITSLKNLDPDAQEDTLIPLSEDDIEQNIDEQTDSTDDDETVLAKLNLTERQAVDMRGRGLLYKQIAQEVGCSRENASLIIRRHSARVLDSMGLLDSKYEERARELKDTFGFRQSPEEIKKVIIYNPNLLNADVKKFKEKFDGVVERLAPYGLTAEKYAQACFLNSTLFFILPDTIFKNVGGVCHQFKDEGLTVEKYVRACVKNPRLFDQKPETVIDNVKKSYQHFQSSGVTLSQYLDICVNRPQLFAQKPQRIIDNINGACQQFEKQGIKVEKERYIKSCLDFPPLLSMTPQKIIENVNVFCKTLSNNGVNIDKTKYAQICLDAPSLLCQKPETLLHNVFGVYNFFKKNSKDVTLDKYIKSCMVLPQLFYQSPETIIKNIRGVYSYFKNNGLSLDKYIKCCLYRPSLCVIKPRTIINNVKSVQKHFQNNGLTIDNYVKACTYHPQLFSTKPETTIKSIMGVYEYFKGKGLTLDKYIHTCLNNPRLFEQSPKTIINNVEKVCEYYKGKGVTLEYYLGRCVCQPALFSSNPETVIKKINAYYYLHGENTKFTTSYATYSFDWLYMSSLVLPRFKEIRTEYKGREVHYNGKMKQIIIDHYKNNPTEKMELTIPSREGVKHCMETLDKFSTENIGRNIFEYKFV